MTPTEQKHLLDSIARALHGWPDDDSRRSYAPSELPALARRLRRKAEVLDAARSGADAPEVVAAKADGCEYPNQD